MYVYFLWNWSNKARFVFSLPRTLLIWRYTQDLIYRLPRTQLFLLRLSLWWWVNESFKFIFQFGSRKQGDSSDSSHACQARHLEMVRMSWNPSCSQQEHSHVPIHRMLSIAMDSFNLWALPNRWSNHPFLTT